MTKVFIDGSAGTTGLRIRERLSDRSDITLVTVPEELRKDLNARKDAIETADVAFLCLPDAASIEIADYAAETDTVIIDTSTAHRVSDGWVFGLPELEGKREAIQTAKRIANPGCHASGFIVLVEPLVRAGIIPKDAHLSCFSLTGYSGGGKKMIAEYESPERSILYSAPRQYGLTQQHKHLKEMKKICNLDHDPVFCPVVADFYSGMETTVSLFRDEINGSLADIQAVLRGRYNSSIVSYTDAADPDGLLSAAYHMGKDSMTVSAFGNEDRIILVSRFDNLGKGASGAAIQNMNITLGLDETTGLNL